MKERLDFVEVDYKKNWPGKSQDLNSVENFWALMKHKLHECDASSFPKLEAALKDI